ncbi:MAG TPA: 50S ribosomal protein L15e [Candidatus Nanoarchaeia archaeon]|nr:50S ribosomal protein L15e [Candidatus Nanoarchaeia archaeon]
MSMYKYIREAWKNPKENLGDLWQKRIVEWKSEPATIRIDNPTRLDRARSLGYKAKQGYLVVRQRVMRHKRQRPKFAGGRKSRHMRRKKVLNMSYQWVAETRAEKAYVNCTVLNSYPVGGDGQHLWYEVILVDRSHPVIKADPHISWISNERGRAQRGLTSAARKSQIKS